MACAVYPSHSVALHIYLVERKEQEAVENLTLSADRSLNAILQVRAVKAETLNSVLYRAANALRVSGVSFLLDILLYC
jgi:hypothetical protein